ncbi:MAG: helix-turn-helix transcriptional regulator [Clostridia bacterium]|nr:helix-turn-helix transcriptional regulator [Clostridia bacterium]
MFYKNELQFLCDTLKKSRVRVLVVTPNESTPAISDLATDNPVGNEPWQAHVSSGELESHTMYKFTDSYNLCYLYFLLPETKSPTVLIVGPYHSSEVSRERIPELLEKREISPARRLYFEEFYRSIPVLTEGCHLFVMLTTFCERIWKSPSFAIVDVNKQNPVSASPINEPMYEDAYDDVLINMKTMEKRYAYENEMIQAVTLGQLHKENQLLSGLSDEVFEKRLPDPLRNVKNYGIIMNTLLRKAAENGGVHPVYLDRTSSEFAAKIENMHELSENHDLMREMFRTYCRLVRRHALMQFSIVVQKTVLLIDSDLSADLSLQSLAQHLNVSAGYLSTIFKKDTGKTVSEYIREKRIHHAKFLLATTHQQIQTIALHCGIMDVQYFSKTFKKLTGKTPKEYRESLKLSQSI